MASLSACGTIIAVACRNYIVHNTYEKRMKNRLPNMSRFNYTQTRVLLFGATSAIILITTTGGRPELANGQCTRKIRTSLFLSPGRCCTSLLAIRHAHERARRACEHALASKILQRPISMATQTSEKCQELPLCYMRTKTHVLPLLVDALWEYFTRMHACGGNRKV